MCGIVLECGKTGGGEVGTPAASRNALAQSSLVLQSLSCKLASRKLLGSLPFG
jgi:hypothetical protein